MLILDLLIIDDLINTKISPALSPEDMPEGVKAEIRIYNGEALTGRTDGAMLVLTDNISLARECVNLENTFTVYVGEESDAEAIYDRLTDLCAKWSSKHLRSRVLKIIGYIYMSYEKVFHEHLLNATIDTVPDMLWYKRLDGIHTMVNEAFTGIVHRTRDDCINKDHFYIWNAPRPEDGNEFSCAESEEIAISTGKTYICDEPVSTREGMKQFTTYKTPIYDPFGKVYGTVGVGHDVTNFSNLGIELAILVENLPFPMVIFTPEHKVVRMNSAFAELSGADVNNTDDFDYLRWKMSRLISEGDPVDDPVKHSTIQEFRLETNDGTRYYQVTELEIRDFFDNISGFFVTMQDLTYQRSYEETIIRAANTDILTGINNRRFFYNYLSENFHRPMMLFYMDLDGFKSVNDKFGHAKGDEVLIQTAEYIKAYFPGCIYARLGGDEFIVAADLRDAHNAKLQANKMEKALTEHFSASALPISISIGISQTDGLSDDIDSFVHEADLRMYEVKKVHHKY